MELEEEIRHMETGEINKKYGAMDGKEAKNLE